METLLASTAAGGEFLAAAIGDRIVRTDYYPPYSKPTITNYQKFSSASGPAFWTAFQVTPGDGGTVNQLGTNPTTGAVQGYYEVGFGYSFQAASSTDYWFDVTFDAGPVTADCAKNSIELQLISPLGTQIVPPVIVPLTSRYLKATATLAANLVKLQPCTLLLNSRVEIAIPAGGRGYGEVIAKFLKLTVSHTRQGIEPPIPFAPEALDLGATRKTFDAYAKGGEIVLQQVSLKEIAQAGAVGFGSFQDGR